MTIADQALPQQQRAERMSVPQDALALVVALTSRLDAEEIHYCHWKSNLALDRSASGDNDLDLLVARRDIRRFTEVLAELGFVRTQKPGAEVPGIENHYGYDAASGRLLHVHAHYQLVLGNDATKNFRLPVEEAYLASVRRDGLFQVPSAEFEYVVLVLRLVLKYAVWDEVAWQALRRRSAGPKPSERRELDDLVARVDAETALALVDEHLPWVGRELFTACVDSLRGARLPARLVTGRRLEAALRACARHAPGWDSLLRLGGRVRLLVRQRTGRPPRNLLATGGVLVAVIGGDGSGKSTAIGDLTRWLDKDVDVRAVHLGKPTWSATTIVVRGALKGLGLVATAVRPVVGDRPLALVTRVRPLLWLACTARDRSLTYRRLHRFVLRGGLVISDRYPHPELRLMDVPQIQRLAEGGELNRFVRWMALIEERYHDRIGRPDLIAVLKVDPEEAVRRKTTEPAWSVRTRSTEIWEMTWQDEAVRVVDASGRPEQVAAELRRLVWSSLA